MKKLVRSVSILLVLAILIALPVQAAQQETAAPYSSAFFTSYGVYIGGISENFFQVWVDITTAGRMQEVGSTSIKIQRSSDGVNWVTIKEYTPDIYKWMIEENTSSYDGCVGYYGTPGMYYRAYVTIYAKNSSGIGKIFDYTQIIRLPAS